MSAELGEQVEQAFNPDVFLTLAGRGKALLEYNERERVYQQGDLADAVYFLQTGKASIAVVSKSGKEAVLEVLGPGDFFGEGCLSGAESRLSTVTAVTQCKITRLDKAILIHTLGNEPKFVDLFLARILAGKTRLEENLLTQILDNSEIRLAKTLLLLANFDKHDMPDPVIDKLSQETLAKMVGTTRSRVNYFMNKFRRLGYIDYNGEVRVHRSLLSVVLHDHPHDHESPPE